MVADIDLIAYDVYMNIYILLSMLTIITLIIHYTTDVLIFSTTRDFKMTQHTQADDLNKDFVHHSSHGCPWLFNPHTSPSDQAALKGLFD